MVVMIEITKPKERTERDRNDRNLLKHMGRGHNDRNKN